MSEQSADEQPKSKIARKVITEKRKYFVPTHGVSIEANDPEDAVNKVKALKSQTEEDGDA